MKDYQASIEKLRKDAAEAALIRDLATDIRKREVFHRLHEHLNRLADLLYLHLDVAFELVEKLLALVPVIILSRVRPADHHHDEIVVIVNALISDRRLQQVPVLIDPLFKIERAADHIN